MSHTLLYFICGSTGAGKTTYSKILARRVGALLFSLDEWMTTLFWVDSPQPPRAEWAIERVQRCQTQIWETALKATHLSVPCILDWGFSARAERAKYFSKGKDAGLSVELHVLDIPADQRWRRVQSRNCENSATNLLPFAVTREMFDFVEKMWEAPSAAELIECSGVLVRSD
jgi:predicted kinase